uniref:ARAD1B20658p n=1 Tax=Blastobotrys adeninivorans TaxID=409370 RepID=A0A060T7M5_BLAAD
MILLPHRSRAMLKSKNLQGVLSQAVQQDKKGSTIISCILTTTSGRPVTSFHNTRPPPVPHAHHVHHEQHNRDESDEASSVSSDSNPYKLDRVLKTKVYGLFAASLWEEYSNGSGGAKWTAVTTEDALLVVRPIEIKSDKLLLLLVADPVTPLGLVVNKSKETAAVLEQGLYNFKVHD